MLVKLRDLVAGLVVYPEHMQRNLELTKGLYHSQTILLELTRRGLERKTAYEAVQRAAMKTWRGDMPLAENLRAEPDDRRRAHRRGDRPSLLAGTASAARGRHVPAARACSEARSARWIFARRRRLTRDAVRATIVGPAFADSSQRALRTGTARVPADVRLSLSPSSDEIIRISAHRCSVRCCLALARAVGTRRVQQDQGAGRQESRRSPAPGCRRSAAPGASPARRWPTGRALRRRRVRHAGAATSAPAINKNAAVMVLCYHRLEEKPRPKDRTGDHARRSSRRRCSRSRTPGSP